MKKVLISLIVFVVATVAVFAGIGMLLPGEYKTERSIVINAKASTIYSTVSDIKTWPEWTYWNEEHVPGLEITYGETTVGKGASQSWTDAEKKTGQLTFVNAKENEFVGTEMIYDEFPPMLGEITIEPNEEGGQTVIWTATGSLGSDPMSGWFGLFMPSLIGRDYDYGLTRLKEICEKQDAPETSDEEVSTDDPEDDTAKEDTNTDDTAAKTKANDSK